MGGKCINGGDGGEGRIYEERDCIPSLGLREEGATRKRSKGVGMSLNVHSHIVNFN